MAEVLLFNKLFLTVDSCLNCKDTARQSCVMVPRCRIFGHYFASYLFSEPRAARFRPASYIRTKATPRVEVW